ncbi:unnamed protein product [Spirodela intermedia]|uniref:NmrA-like domain-containing protein n=1 Tax=Spirodela intermedia TaxID=51605 RepID=A0A7I8K6P0_SPIIN|nr:unnamed protein product [Spirodela intermedia]
MFISLYYHFIIKHSFKKKGNPGLVKSSMIEKTLISKMLSRVKHANHRGICTQFSQSKELSLAEGTRERERERERERQDCERRAVEETGIPFTYISAGCFAGYMAGGFCQLGEYSRARTDSTLCSLSLSTAVFVDEDDIATYAVMTINDPRAANKTVYIRPPENVLSQMNLVRLWEELIGRQLEKPRLSSDDFFSAMKGMDYSSQVAMGHFYQVFYEGCLTNFDVGEEASELYREVPYRRMRDYLKRYL